MPLVNPRRLSLALINLTERNQLIDDLTATPNHPFAFAREVLAFLLGANQLQTHLVQSKPGLSIFFGELYLVFWWFERYLGLPTPQDSVAKKEARGVFENMFQHLNQFTDWDIRSAATLFYHFQMQLKRLNAPEISVTRKHCLEAISNFRPINDYQLTPVYHVWNPHQQAHPFPLIKLIGIYTQQLITQNVRLFPLPMIHLKENRLKKVFLPSRDNVILDGFHIEPKEYQGKTIVIALIGHFANEEFYLGENLYRFQKLFGTHFISINHRNYANRSNQYGTTPYDFANDMVDYAHYFLKKGFNIVLYGMCGGAAHTLLAAAQLHEQGIPFKLIIDRFATRYTNFYGYKTVARILNLEYRGEIEAAVNFSEITFRTIKYINQHFLLLLLFALCAIPFYLALLITKSNIAFDNVIRSLPQNNVLILQAKPEKTDKLNELLVHPKNDLRTATKSARQMQKTVLKRLKIACIKLADLNEKYADVLVEALQSLQDSFQKALELIDNEKLTQNRTPQSLQCIHSSRLFDVTTRHHLPLSRFLQGFFKLPQKNYEKDWRSIRSLSLEHWSNALAFMSDDQDKKFSAETWKEFFDVFSANKTYLSYIANRLVGSGFGDIQIQLSKILNMPFIKTMKQPVTSPAP